MGLWITYAWKDNEEGDFDYLVQELDKHGINVRYDKIELIPGQRLWSQIEAKINDPNTNGWAYLITPNSLASQPCMEELYYALDKALATEGGNFPMLGLVAPGVSFSDLPAALKTRLCIRLSNPDWKELVQAGLEKRPAQLTARDTSALVVKASQKVKNGDLITTIEVRPRFNELHFWRIAVPSNYQVIDGGDGPANSGEIASTQLNYVSGDSVGKIGEIEVSVRGSGGPLTPGSSGYLFTKGAPPEYIFFGTATAPFGQPTTWTKIPLV